MTKEKFREIKLSKKNQEQLVMINQIIKEYAQDGYTMTLRQLYYQLVSKDIIPNKDTEYKKLSKLLKEGRMAGWVDWDAIEDRLRAAKITYSVTSPSHAIQDAINHYRLNRQKNQDTYIEVWVEKDALSGVLTRITSKYHVRLLVNRGYGSVTAIHDAYRRTKPMLEAGRKVKILYLGDHDPSGVDMIRDVRDRLGHMLSVGCDLPDSLESDVMVISDNMTDDNPTIDHEDAWKAATAIISKEFIQEQFSVDCIAITTAQIKEHKPPPNPAKVTDPRAKGYIKKFGTSSWEVDALNPKTLNKILSDHIEKNMDMDLYRACLKQEDIDVEKLEKMAELI